MMYLGKPKRIKDPKLLKRINDNGYCQICPKWETDPHHIKTKGSGGDDVSENIVRLCTWEHHPKAHAGLISKDYLRELALIRIKEEGE